MKKDTAWNKSGVWYNDLVEQAGSYQKDVILPNLQRLVSLKKGMKLLDLGCGTGFFSRAWRAAGVDVIGLDNSKDMVKIARESDPLGTYTVGNAENLPQYKTKMFDAVTIVMAIQNMEHPAKVFKECARVLKPQGSVYLVMNHPCFRVPKNSSWEWNSEKSIQFRRVDTYLSESKNKIQMHPGQDPTDYTVSFHRPLQTYSKILNNNGFAITRFEEWISNRIGPKGKTFAALEQSRKEIPLFLFMEARLIVH